MSVCAAPTCSHQSFVGSSYYVDVETIELFPLPIYPYLLLFQFPPRNVRIIVDLFPLPMYPCSSQFPLETFESQSSCFICQFIPAPLNSPSKRSNHSRVVSLANLSLLLSIPPRNVRIIVDLFPLSIYPCLFLSQSPLETLETQSSCFPCQFIPSFASLKRLKSSSTFFHST